MTWSHILDLCINRAGLKCAQLFFLTKITSCPKLFNQWALAKWNSNVCNCILPKLHFGQQMFFWWALAKWYLCRKLDGLVSDLLLIRGLSFWETQPKFIQKKIKNRSSGCNSNAYFNKGTSSQKLGRHASRRVRSVWKSLG